MNLLLDSHTLIWSYFDPTRLSAAAATHITDPNNWVFVSAATLWEIALKISIRKLNLAESYVWSESGDGRVPVHGCSLPDGTDMYYDQSLKNMKSFVDGTFTGIGVRRVQDTYAFYLYPKPKDTK